MAAPTTADADVIGIQDFGATIYLTDFPYNDTDGDPLTEIQILSLPATGRLGKDLNADGLLEDEELISVNDILTDIDLENYLLDWWLPPEDLSGYRVDSFTFTVSDGNSSSAEATMYLSLDATSAELPGTAGQDGWHLLANPWSSTPAEFLSNFWTQGATGANTSNGSPNVYIYDEPNSSYQPVADLNQPLSDGQGMAVYVYADEDFDGADEPWPKTLNPIGSLETVPASIPITNTDSGFPPGPNGDEGWNLIVNPFGTALEVDSVIAEMSRAEVFPNSNVYIWDKSLQSGNGDWAVLSENTGAKVAPYQAMFVRAQNPGITSATLTLENDDRAAGTATFFRDSENQRAELMLQLSHNQSGLQQSAGIQFSESGLEGIDPDDIFSLRPLSDTYIRFYSVVGDQALKVSSLPNPTRAMEVLHIPFMVESSETGRVDLSWQQSGLAPGIYMMLTDTQTGRQIDLNKEARYSFDIEALITEESSTVKMPVTASSKPNQDAPRFVLSISMDNLQNDPEMLAEIPEQFELHQNFPNPFNPTTSIRYGLSEATEIKLKVVDLAGRVVATLVDERQPAGTYTLNWDASHLASGMYVYQLITEKQTLTRKMMLIK